MFSYATLALKDFPRVSPLPKSSHNIPNSIRHLRFGYLNRDVDVFTILLYRLSTFDPSVSCPEYPSSFVIMY